jgi:Flp pilus assembly protein TadB
MPTSNKGNFMMLTLKQRAALDVAKLIASAAAGAIFLNILIAYVSINYIIMGFIFGCTVYALYQVYLMRVDTYERLDKINQSLIK